MINKHSIYNWLIFPLLASLLAGSATSCINDPTMEEEDTSGKTTLSITVRGVTNSPEQDGYDEYIQTLRIIVFDASGKVYNQLYLQDDIEKWDIKTSGTDTYYEITQVLENFPGGSSNFYFIANEEGYDVSTSTSLSEFLGGTFTEDDLKTCIMASTSDDVDWSNKPILMIANPSAQYIKPGENNTIADVRLVRCVAKVQLIVQKKNSTEDDGVPENDKVTISNVSLHGTRSNSYSLWDTKSYFATNNSEYTHSFTITDINETVGYGTDDFPAYTSDMVYFPETLSQNNTTEGVLYFTFTLTYTPDDTTKPTIERTYTFAVGKDADDNGIVEDYNIYRNTSYTVTVTLLGWDPIEITMDIQVNAWSGVTIDVPAFE